MPTRITHEMTNEIGYDNKSDSTVRIVTERSQDDLVTITASADRDRSGFKEIYCHLDKQELAEYIKYLQSCLKDMIE